MDMAFEIIQAVNERISCRCVLLECREINTFAEPNEKEQRLKLHKKYQDYGFEALQKEDNLVQYIILI